jgi:hypothetical protein
MFEIPNSWTSQQRKITKVFLIFIIFCCCCCSFCFRLYLLSYSHIKLLLFFFFCLIKIKYFFSLHRTTKFEALVSAGNENIIHHIGMIACNQAFEVEYLANNDLPIAGECYQFNRTENEWTRVLKYCSKKVLWWADYEGIPKVKRSFLPS